MDLPLILAGPILRRVEPKLVSVWIALRTACTLKLSVWENQLKTGDAQDSNVFFRSPDPGVNTVRVGDQLHVIVVTLRLPEAKTLVPERLYSYDLEIVQQGQSAKQNFKSLGLLTNDPSNANPDGDNVKRLALGYEVDLLPCLLLPPQKLTDLRIVHGSCRDINSSLDDGLAWLDDLLSKDDAHKSAIKRPHQLFLTGDQIYADEVPRPLMKMLNETAKQLIGTTTEQLPFRDPSQTSKIGTAPADLAHFPVGGRNNLILNEAGMTTNARSDHLMSFGEFCAMYLYAWSNACWGDQLDNIPAHEDFVKLDLSQVRSAEPGGAALLRAITTNDAGDTVLFETVVGDTKKATEIALKAYEVGSYDSDVANLKEFHRTLPKVSRALANVPSYMIFDDHEITDDWYLNQTWRDRVLGSPLGSAIVRNGMMAYALFQGWGNDPVKYEPRVGITEEQPHEQLLELTALFLPASAAGAPNTGPDPAPGGPAAKIEELLGLTLRNKEKLDGSFAETDPPLKWFYTVPGTKHQVLVLDCRTRRAFASRVSPPGNIGKDAQKEQIPDEPQPKDRELWIVVASLPVLGPPIFDALLAPLLPKVFDALDAAGSNSLQRNRGTKRMPGTNPDAVEGWAFDSDLFENLLGRLRRYSPVVILSGDVHYSATNAMSYWFKAKKDDVELAQEPARIAQFISSGLRNIVPATITVTSRSFALAQKMIRSEIGAERLAWEKSSPKPVDVPAEARFSPHIRGLLRKSPVLVPTVGWHGVKETRSPDWAWRSVPILDVREDKDRPPMARPASLFPDDRSKTNNDLTTPNLDGYHRIAERHARQLDRLSNSRQLLFGACLGLVTFEERTEQNLEHVDVKVTFAIHDLYTAYPDPEELIARPKPLVYTRHEVPLRDLRGQRPRLKEDLRDI